MIFKPNSTSLKNSDKHLYRIIYTIYKRFSGGRILEINWQNHTRLQNLKPQYKKLNTRAITMNQKSIQVE